MLSFTLFKLFYINLNKEYFHIKIMSKILFVCGTPPHPVHATFAKSINADFFHIPEKISFKKIKVLAKIPKDYDIYFSEGLFTYTYLLKLLGKIKKNSKLINLFADPRIYHLINNQKFDFKSLKIKKHPLIKKIFQLSAIENLDGAICVGNYEKEILKKINPKLPSEAVFASIERQDFFKFKSKLKENNLLFIGEGPDYNYKGLDNLIKVFLKVKEQNKKPKLFIIGRGWENFKKSWAKHPDILFLGKKDINEIKKYMNKSSIYCHFGRGDTFPVVTLEAMTSGIPTIVSNETGTKEVVEKVDESFVVNQKNINEISKKILNYFKKPIKQKMDFGKKFQKQASYFNEKNCTNIFKKKWKKLLKEV